MTSTQRREDVVSEFSGETGSGAAQPGEHRAGDPTTNGHRPPPLGPDSAGRKFGDPGYNAFDTGRFHKSAARNGGAAAGLEGATRKRLEWLRVDREARRRIADDDAATIELPPVTSLEALLAEEDAAVPFRIETLHPAGGARTLLAAPDKAGKTTLVGNLARSLVDGDPFLGRFPVHIPAARLVIIDTEMSKDMLKRWLRTQGIRNTAAVADVVSLRGQVGLFDLGNDRIRDRWARRLSDLGCDYLIFDCLAPVFDALNLDPNRETGKFLTPFDELLKEAGIGDALLTHHMGHQHERARGDSRLLGWPDGHWKIVRLDPDDPTSERHFSAYGRGGEVSEGRLDLDPATQHLTYTGESRSQTRHDAGVENALIRVREVLAEKRAEDGGEMSTRAIRQAVRGKYETVTAALALAVRRNLVTVRCAGLARFYVIRPEAVDPTVTSVPVVAEPSAAPTNTFEADIPGNML